MDTQRSRPKHQRKFKEKRNKRNENKIQKYSFTDYKSKSPEHVKVSQEG